MEIERLKMWVRGKAIAGAAALSIREEMPSGPEEVLQGRFEMSYALFYGYTIYGLLQLISLPTPVIDMKTF